MSLKLFDGLRKSQYESDVVKGGFSLSSRGTISGTPNIPNSQLKRQKSFELDINVSQAYFSTILLFIAIEPFSPFMMFCDGMSVKART